MQYCVQVLSTWVDLLFGLRKADERNASLAVAAQAGPLLFHKQVDMIFVWIQVQFVPETMGCLHIEYCITASPPPVYIELLQVTTLHSERCRTWRSRSPLRSGTSVTSVAEIGTRSSLNERVTSQRLPSSSCAADACLSSPGLAF